MNRYLFHFSLLVAVAIATVGLAMAGPADECDVQAAEAFRQMPVVPDNESLTSVTRDFVGLHSARRSGCVLLLRIRHVDLRAGWPMGKSLARVSLKLTDLSSGEVLGEFRKWDEHYAPELCQAGADGCGSESDWLLKVLSLL